MAPVLFSAMKSFHAPGSASRRRVCPVGAVSRIMLSNSSAAWGSPNMRENSLKLAISVVHAPDSCSSMFLTVESGSTPRIGPIIRSR